jgi:hypothetical protein
VRFAEGVPIATDIDSRATRYRSPARASLRAHMFPRQQAASRYRRRLLAPSALRRVLVLLLKTYPASNNAITASMPLSTRAKVSRTGDRSTSLFTSRFPRTHSLVAVAPAHHSNKYRASSSVVDVANSGSRAGFYHDSDVSRAVSARTSPRAARSSV